MAWNFERPDSKEVIKIIVFRLFGRIQTDVMYETKFCLYSNEYGFFIGEEKITDIIAWKPNPKSPPKSKWNNFIKGTFIEISEATNIS